MKIRGTGGGGRWGKKKDQTGMNRGCLEGRNYSGKVEVFSSFALIFFLPLSLFFSPLLLLLLSSFSLCYYIILFLPYLVLPTLHLFIFLCHSLPPTLTPIPLISSFSSSCVPLSFPPPQVINVEQSSVSLMPSRVEISLVKADPGSWAQLEHPDALAEKAKAGVGLEMDEEESEDSDDDLSWTEEEEEEEAMGE